MHGCILGTKGDLPMEMRQPARRAHQERQASPGRTRVARSYAIALPTQWPVYGVTTPVMRTTSKSLPLSAFSVFISASFQRASAVPETYQLLPLSATIIPYFLSARRMTCALAG